MNVLVQSVQWADLDRDERTNLLRANFEPGTSAGTIEKQLPKLKVVGASRNAVIGHVHRNMPGELFSAGNLEPVQKISPKPKIPADKIIKLRKSRGLTVQQNDNPDFSDAKTIMELTEKDCRYPLWDHQGKPTDESLYCGKPKAPGSVWCEQHRKICCQQV